jgi:hypothetical protein
MHFKGSFVPVNGDSGSTAAEAGQGSQDLVEARPPEDLATDPGPASANSSGGAKSTSPRVASALSTGLPSPADDPFDPERLRLSQDFDSAVGVRRALTTIPVRKPAKQWWIRTHPDRSYWLTTTVLDLSEDRELFLVDPLLRQALEAEPTVGTRLLVPCITRQATIFIWALKMPGPDGKIIRWHQSSLAAADLAQSKWTRVYADMNIGAYHADVSDKLRDGPTWPDLAPKELYRIAFHDRHINTLDHPILRQLRGEV